MAADGAIVRWEGVLLFAGVIAYTVLQVVVGRHEVGAEQSTGEQRALTCVLGGAALASRGPIPISAQALAFDFPVMVAVALACLPVFFTGHRIARWEGVLFLAQDALYTTWLVLAARGSTTLPGIAAASTWFLFPLTAITLGLASWRWWRQSRLGVEPA